MALLIFNHRQWSNIQTPDGIQGHKGIKRIFSSLFKPPAVSGAVTTHAYVDPFDILFDELRHEGYDHSDSMWLRYEHIAPNIASWLFHR